jgi:hypothetical protein
VAFVRVSFDVAGAQQYERAFEMMEAETRDLTDPLREVGDSVRAQVGHQFDTQGMAGLGSRWLPLSPEYQAWKAEHYPETAHLILIRTYAMREAAQSERAVTVTPNRMVYEIKGRDAEGKDIGARARWHHLGSGDNPRRPIVEIPSATRRDWDRIFHEWLNEIRHRTGTVFQ